MLVSNNASSNTRPCGVSIHQLPHSRSIVAQMTALPKAQTQTNSVRYMTSSHHWLNRSCVGERFDSRLNIARSVTLTARSAAAEKRVQESERKNKTRTVVVVGGGEIRITETSQ